MSNLSNFFWAGFGGAVAGSLLTFIAIIFGEWFRRFLARRFVRVKLGIGCFVGDSEKQVFYEATNVNWQPVTLSSFGLRFKGSKWAKLKIMPRRSNMLPFELGCKNILTYWSPMNEMIVTLGTAGREPRDLHSVWFESSSGDLFHRKIGKWFIRELEKAISGEARELYSDALGGRILATGQPRESAEKVGVLIR